MKEVSNLGVSERGFSFSDSVKLMKGKWWLIYICDILRESGNNSTGKNETI